MTLSMTQHQQLYQLQKKAGLIKGKKTSGSGRALEARVVTLAGKTDNSCGKSLFADEKPKANNLNNPALDRKEMVLDRAMQTLDVRAI